MYLDYNATAPLLPEAKKAMMSVIDEPLNASSVHQHGRKAKRVLEEARREILKAAGAEGAELIFTSSGTEANNLAIRGFYAASVIVTATEHPCVLEPAKDRDAIIAPVNEHGVIDLSTLEKLLKHAQQPVLISTMMANNETGVIQPIEKLVALARKYKAYTHCDAAQSVGRIPVDFLKLGIDMMTISSHKIGGPHGSAALIVKPGIQLNAQLLGGGQEKFRRSGTQNVPAILGFAKAAQSAGSIGAGLRDYLEKEIKAYAPDAVIAGAGVERLPNTSNIILEGMTSETQLINFDLADIAVSNGSACSSGKVGASHVLQAMGINDKQARCAIRISYGPETTQACIDAFLNVWKQNYDKVHASQAA